MDGARTKVDQDALVPQIRLDRLAAEILADSRLVKAAGRNHEIVAASVAIDPYRSGGDMPHGA